MYQTEIESKAQSIYIHLPFCKTKCPYCDFASFAKVSEWDLKRDYLDALLNEIKHKMNLVRLEKISTIFFGGGTPSVHSPEEIKAILQSIKKHSSFADDIEITMELNPGTVDKEKLQAFVDIGINRVSFGAQSFDEKLLEKLGRGHSLQDSFDTVEILQNLDLKSWSFDLIYGLPGQSLASWQDTVNQALSFEPKHISAYALSIETGTPYGDIYKNSLHPSLPQEDLLADMYLFANDKFAATGLQRYEISNWALAGHECRHNLCYWQAHEYLAFGLSAHGYIDSRRYSNTRDLRKYIETFQQDSQDFFYAADTLDLITPAEAEEEEFMLALRLNTGISRSSTLFSKLNQSKLQEFIEQSLCSEENGVVSLTAKGALLSNEIIFALMKT